MDYDEDGELTQYIWKHYERLVTEFERQVGRAALGRTKAAASDSPEVAGMLNRLWGRFDEAEVEAALADGPEAFRRRVRDRVLADHGLEVFVNRCPQCRRVVRTPQSRQCLWCGFDWHGLE